MASGSAPTRAFLESGRARLHAGHRRALAHGTGIAIALLAGSLVAAALLRLAMHDAGASAIADPLDLPATTGPASPAQTWSYVLFQSSLLPHPLLSTRLWSWGGGALLLTGLIAVLAFRAGREDPRPAEALLVVAPSLLVGLTAGAAELFAGGDPVPLAISPLVVALPAAGLLSSIIWTRLAARRAWVPWLRGAMAAACAVPVGATLATIPVLAIAPPGHEPPGSWMVALVAFAPNAVVRAAFAGQLQVQTAVALACFAAAAVVCAVHLRARSAAERAGFFLAGTGLLALCTLLATPVAGPAGAGLALAGAVPRAAAAALLGALVGPILGRTSWGHRLAMAGALRALGDRLPPPPAAELTAADMAGAEPGTQDAMPAHRPPVPRAAIGPVAVGTALVALLAAVAAVAAVTLTEGPPADAAPELRAARAYLEASATNDADRIWPAVSIDSSSVPAGATRMLGKADLARMLTVIGNQHSPPTSIRLDVIGRSGGVTRVRARYLEAGIERESTLALTPVPGSGWKVVLVPSAISVSGAQRARVMVDGGAVVLPAGQPVAVLPGVHSVEAEYPPPYSPSRITVVADQPYPEAAAAALAPHLDDAQLAAARALVGGAVRQCAASAAPQPARCPQSIGSTAGEAVRWTVVGDPGATVSVLTDPGGALVATGVFEMVAAYDVHVPEDVKHVASGGTFRVPLDFAGGWRLAGGVIADEGSVPRPAAFEADLVAAVRAGFGQCAASHLLRPADCPQTLPSRFYVKDVAWQLDSDPLAGAQTGFDAGRGVLTVSGAYAMTCSYNEGGQPKRGQSSGRYRADLVWDGQKAVLVNIDRT